MILYDFLHNNLGTCFWLFPSFLVGVAMVVMGLTHSYRHKKREREFEERLEALQQ